ncbi:bifunctional diaminohydroxyphosphoribosylaminopyrimidine deaminase/5-amino-6-(5-phosphoribosylamino)uracil reductase RibD [uncultured Campylobacter sp.]|uniref:bifunctional diaminohydroxyphosphoribosylaminopyrimidine deaminase/5-amino-6-(5-phosphoribosylamino)uracil reductase RibD n=1 Tax=uncultured Campylobacter sp. TaxID=218934 RepID=UPI00261B2A97|nr:bifunctional diaminohydroxyphosphoribosylaminopyrimidine deaminase/5-amino-6-(5-phosphoribosylamino)uracil reductase RibD [uncultured Campylobacter sp.]
MNDEFYMDLALRAAWRYQALTLPNPAVGCALLDKSGRVLSIGAHKKAGFLHAEVNAVFAALCDLDVNFAQDFACEYARKFGVKFQNTKALKSALLQPSFTYDFILNRHGGLLGGACAYVTLEPCAHRGKTPSCAELLAQLGLSRVVIGARDTNAQAAGGAEILRRGGIEVKFDVCHTAAAELAEPFYLARESSFCFIKINAALNGVVHGRIGSEKQRAFVHELRGVCDYVGVGGQTVRADRPTLDVRAAKSDEISALVGRADMLALNTRAPELGEISVSARADKSALDARVAPQNLKPRAPDVWIYSHRALLDFDESIPLFGVAGRKVEVSQSLPADAKITMIEAGASSFDEFAQFASHALIFYSAQMRNAGNFKANAALQPLFISSASDPHLEANEFYGWFKILK